MPDIRERRAYGILFQSRDHWVTSIAPTLGAELIADPGLEGTYTAGVVAALTKGGSPTVSESADVHGGSKAQAFTATALNDLLRIPITPLANTFYRFSVWGKRTAGTNSKVYMTTNQTGGTAIRSQYWTSAAYAQKAITYLSPSINAISFYLALETGTVTFDSLIFDDVSLTPVNLASCLKTFWRNTATATVKAGANSISGNPIGVVANLDNKSNPLNFVLAVVMVEVETARALLYQCSNGVFTLKQNTVVTYAADGQIEIRHTAPTTYQIWYRGAQVGTDQTISDAAINNNTLYCQFSSFEGNTFSSFEVFPNP